MGASGCEVVDLPTLLSGLQTHGDPAQLQQSPGGPDTLAVPGEDRRQGGAQPAEPQAGVSQAVRGDASVDGKHNKNNNNSNKNRNKSNDDNDKMDDSVLLHRLPGRLQPLWRARRQGSGGGSTAPCRVECLWPLARTRPRERERSASARGTGSKVSVASQTAIRPGRGCVWLFS